MSGRTNYYTHNKLAMDEPLLYKSTIHDGMDSAKTSLPRTVNYAKALAGVGAPVPLKLAGILNRGDRPPMFAHVCIGGLWKQDPNFTISSIAQYLRDCENFNGDMRGDLDFRKEVDHPLLKAFMRQDIFEKTVLAPKHQTAAQFFNLDDEVANSHDRPFKKLPSIFYIQLDNSGKDNKNWAVMSFLSELVMHGVFKTVVMSFLIVRHTHEDVDAYFSKNQHVPEPLSAPMNRIYDKKEEIVSYLTAYIAHIGAIQSRTFTSNESYALDQAIIDYWKNIKSVFEGAAWETYEGRPLKHGFWPRTNHGTGYQRPGEGNHQQDGQMLEMDHLMKEAEEELLE
ncbi:hypothetical protein R1sor_011639 [Riccia sorocarpa]|uniref:DUF7869 domain-containing protein n=1 Tax=Riccia sorocarpa TaxID=122646 RepID=A0ABD3I1J5_9MARC